MISIVYNDIIYYRRLSSKVIVAYTPIRVTNTIFKTESTVETSKCNKFQEIIEPVGRGMFYA